VATLAANKNFFMGFCFLLNILLISISTAARAKMPDSPLSATSGVRAESSPPDNVGGGPTLLAPVAREKAVLLAVPSPLRNVAQDLLNYVTPDELQTIAIG
jgi:hypothetical protein